MRAQVERKTVSGVKIMSEGDQRDMIKVLRVFVGRSHEIEMGAWYTPWGCAGTQYRITNQT